MEGMRRPLPTSRPMRDPTQLRSTAAPTRLPFARPRARLPTPPGLRAARGCLPISSMRLSRSQPEGVRGWGTGSRRRAGPEDDALGERVERVDELKLGVAAQRDHLVHLLEPHRDDPEARHKLVQPLPAGGRAG